MSKTIKISIIGDEEVGKTSITLRWVKNTFTGDYKPTLGADFAVKELNYDGEIVKVNVWDLMGTHRFDIIRPFFLRDSNAIMLVFDGTNHQSFINAFGFWMVEIMQIDWIVEKQIPIILVMNKVDLPSIAVYDYEIDEKIKSRKIDSFFKTSAKENIGVDELFEGILKNIL